MESENYRPKDIVKYPHLSPSGNRALQRKSASHVVDIFCKKALDICILKGKAKPRVRYQKWTQLGKILNGML